MTQWNPIESMPLNRPVLVSNGVLVVSAEKIKILSDKTSIRPVAVSGPEWEWDIDISSLIAWAEPPEPPKRDRPYSNPGRCKFRVCSCPEHCLKGYCEDYMYDSDDPERPGERATVRCKL